MVENHTVVRVYEPHAHTVASIKKLQRSGFDINKLSIVGKDYHSSEHLIGRDDSGDRMKAWCQLGEIWGGLSGLLFGSAFFLIPGIGPVIVFGPLVKWTVRALEGAVKVGGLGALGAGLCSIGVPQHQIMEYGTALKSDKFLVIAHGTLDEMARANGILETIRAGQVAAHCE
ncbi:MAG: permease [Nitrospirota bacterium]|nr:permease [Nitrospirota bacterium]